MWLCVQFVVVSKGVQLGICSVLKLVVDRNVCLDKEGLVVVIYVGVGNGNVVFQTSFHRAAARQSGRLRMRITCR